MIILRHAFLTYLTARVVKKDGFLVNVTDPRETNFYCEGVLSSHGKIS